MQAVSNAVRQGEYGMSDRKYKGFGLMSCFRWIDENLDEEEKARVVATLPEACRAEMSSLKPQKWYPLQWFDILLRAVADEKGTTLEEKFSVVGELAVYAAHDNQTTVIKLLMKFLTVNTFLKQLPKFWSKYFDSGVIEIIETTEENTGCIQITDFSGVRYIEPIVSSWVRTAYEMLGVTSFEIKEVINPLEEENPTDFRWEFKWTT